MMTVTRLHKELTRLIEAGHGRKPVCIDKGTFWHALEADGALILDVSRIDGPYFVPTADDDGGVKENKDGTESGKYSVVLRGDDPLGNSASAPDAR